MLFFSRKKKKAEKKTPEDVLAAAFSDAYRESSGQPVNLSILEAHAEDEIPGKTAVLIFSGSNIPIAAYAPGNLDDTGAPSEARAKTLCRSWLSASLLARDQEMTVCSVSLEGPGIDAFRWQVMELKAFDLCQKPDQKDGRIWLSSRLWEVLKARQEVIAQKKPDSFEIAGSGMAPGFFLAERPRDLPVLEIFSAPGFRSDNRNYATVIHRFGAARNGSDVPAIIEAPVWFKASFEYFDENGETPRPKALSFLYALSASALPQKNERSESVRILTALAGSLFSGSVRKFLLLSGLRPGRLGIKVLEAAPELSNAGALISVDFSIQASGLSVPGAVFAPAGILALLAKKRSLPSAVIDGETGPADLLCKLNAAILAENLPALIASPELRTQIPHFCLNELFRLLSDHDEALIVQNVLIPEYGDKGLPGLLFYTEDENAGDGQVKEYRIPFGPLDMRRLEAFMPAAFRDPFLQHIKSLHGRNRQDCATGNAEAMRKILQAVRAERIGTSPRLAYLLREFVIKESRIETEKKLAVLKESGIPFGRLHEFEPKRAQRICAVLDDRDIALALLDCADELSSLSRFISAARRNRLREDLLFLKKRLQNGDLELSESLSAKERILSATEKDKMKEQKEGT